MREFLLLSAALFLLTGAVLAQDPAAEEAPMEESTGPRVRLETSLGSFVIELNEDKAPLTAANFLAYVDSGFFEGTVFHRVIPDFMVQGGGFSADLVKKDTSAAIQNEAKNGLDNDRGTVAMARTPNPHSATAQFFVNLVDNDFLNHANQQGEHPAQSGWGYAVFGKVVEGMDTVDAIAAVKTSNRGRMANVPVEPVLITKASRLTTP
nr:peptidyl-prolyl cis-trans isomerase cyp18-like [Nerophis lumbriciformis]